MRLLTMNEAAETTTTPTATVPLETLASPRSLHPSWKREDGCVSATTAVRPSVCRPLSQFPHMTLASSNMCDGRGSEEEGEGEAGGGEHLSLHL